MTMLDERTRFGNQARFLEEVSEGIRALMESEAKNKAWLAATLGRSRPFVSKILEGSHNFTLETLADVCLALGRGVHITLGESAAEMRVVVDEAKLGKTFVATNPPVTTSPPLVLRRYAIRHTLSPASQARLDELGDGFSPLRNAV